MWFISRNDFYGKYSVVWIYEHFGCGVVGGAGSTHSSLLFRLINNIRQQNGTSRLYLEHCRESDYSRKAIGEGWTKYYEVSLMIIMDESIAQGLLQVMYVHRHHS